MFSCKWLKTQLQQLDSFIDLQVNKTDQITRIFSKLYQLWLQKYASITRKVKH